MSANTCQEELSSVKEPADLVLGLISIPVLDNSTSTSKMLFP